MNRTQPRDRLIPEIDRHQIRSPFRQGGASRAPLLLVSVAAATLVLAGSLALDSLRSGPNTHLAAAVGPTSVTYLSALRPVERPAGLAASSDGTVYVVDSARGRVNVFSPDGQLAGTIGFPAVEGGQDSERRGGQLTSPLGVAVDEASGRVLVSDLATRRISSFALDGTFRGYFGTDALADSAPGILYVRDHRLYLCDLEQHRVLALSLDDGALLASYGGAGATMNYPNGVWVAEEGTVYVADTNGNRIHRFAADGQLEQTIPLPAYNPRGIARDDRGRLWVAATLDHRVVVLGDDGEIDSELNTANSRELGFPTSVVVLGDRVFVTDRAGHAVQIWRLGN